MYGLIHGLLLAWTIAAVVAEKTITLTVFQNQPALNHHRTLSKKRQTAEASPLHNLFGREYSVEIGIGTPPQYFNVTIDTGSVALWVASSECPNDQCPVPKFIPEASSTYILSQEGYFQLAGILTKHYVTSRYSFDTVTIGNNLTVPNQGFGAAVRAGDMLTDAFGYPSSGGLGLGIPTPKSKTLGDPFVHNLIKANRIASPIFSIYLNSQYQYENRGNGEILLGGIDASKYEGQLQYADVQRLTEPRLGLNNDYAYWAVRGAGITVTSANGETTYNHSLSDNFVFDTGSTISYAPADVVRSIVDSITKSANFNEEEELYYVDCDIPNGTVTLKVAGTNSSIIDLPVSVRELIYPLDTLDPRDAKQCIFALAPLDVASAPGNYMPYLIGQSVMRSLYTVHDIGNYRMGFAKAVLSPQSDDSLNRTRPFVSDKEAWGPMKPSSSAGGGGGYVESGGRSIKMTMASGCSHMVLLLTLVLYFV